MSLMRRRAARAKRGKRTRLTWHFCHWCRGRYIDWRAHYFLCGPDA